MRAEGGPDPGCWPWVLALAGQLYGLSDHGSRQGSEVSWYPSGLCDIHSEGGIVGGLKLSLGKGTEASSLDLEPWKHALGVKDCQTGEEALCGSVE